MRNFFSTTTLERQLMGELLGAVFVAPSARETWRAVFADHTGGFYARELPAHATWGVEALIQRGLLLPFWEGDEGVLGFAPTVTALRFCRAVGEGAHGDALLAGEREAFEVVRLKPVGPAPAFVEALAKDESLPKARYRFASWGEYKRSDLSRLLLFAQENGRFVARGGASFTSFLRVWARGLPGLLGAYQQGLVGRYQLLVSASGEGSEVVAPFHETLVESALDTLKLPLVIVSVATADGGRVLGVAMEMELPFAGELEREVTTWAGALARDLSSGLPLAG